MKKILYILNNGKHFMLNVINTYEYAITNNNNVNSRV